MPSFTRSQLIVYGALAVVLLLLGGRWIRSQQAADADAGEVAFADASGNGGESGIDVEQEGEDAVVHVAGEVRSPGVYRLPAGSRVADAIERAGGATGDAAADAINLAAELGDGQQVVVPARSGATATAAGGAVAAADVPISLGSATLEQLETIDGIGPVTAQSILDFRDEQGGISTLDELDQVSGIGPATMEALRGRLQP